MSTRVSALAVAELMRIFTADEALDATACDVVRRAMDEGVAEPGEVLGSGIALDEEVRRVVHVEVAADVLALVERRLDAYRDPIARFFGVALSAREGASVLRYAPGGFYRPHADRGDVPSWPAAAIRLVTVVLFLDSSRDADPAGAFDGGFLRLLPRHRPPIEIVPVRGRLVAFPADTVHEVTPVRGGSRDAVIDWFA